MGFSPLVTLGYYCTILENPSHTFEITGEFTTIEPFLDKADHHKIGIHLFETFHEVICDLFFLGEGLHSPKQTQHVKNGHWKTSFLLGPRMLSGANC